MEPIFVVTSRTTNEMRVPRPRASADVPLEYDTRIVYNIGIHAQYPDQPGVQGPGLGFQTDSPEKYPIGAKFQLTPITDA